MSVESAVAAAQAVCTHTKIDGTTATVSHKFLNGQLWVRCARCGKQWNSAPTSQVIVLAGDWKEYINVCKAFGDNHKAPMKFFDATHSGVVGKHFTECFIVGTFFDRENWIEELQMARIRLTTSGNNAIKFYGFPGYHIKSWDTVGGPNVYNEKGELCCARCKKKCYENYKGGFCASCPKPNYGSKAMHHKKSKIVGGGITKQEYDAYGFGGSPILKKATTFQPEHKQGDIWKLPKANAPFRSEQWAYQGSGKAPYVITRYEDKRDGAVTEDGWACSCMSFTRNVPRTPCKHILNVMLKEGLGSVKKSTAKLANVDDKTMSEFEKWQREQAALKAGKQPVTGEAKLNLFGNTGRKFR